MGSLSDHNGLQTIDISDYLHSNDPVSRKAKADELVKAIHGQGACGIVGHNIHIDTWREALQRSKEFFDLPLEEKRKVDHPHGTVPHRGYTGVGRERIYSKDELEAMADDPGVRTDKALDWKEHYDIGSDQEPIHHNRWVDEKALPGFRAFMTDFLQKLEQLHRAVLDALLLGLEVEPSEADYFRSLHAGPQSGFRLLHYPSLLESTIDRQATTWCPPHTDFTTFTFLIQDQNQGLEIEDRSQPGTFIPATTEIRDRIWFTMGDFGEVWSNGYLPASKHRVMIPSPPPGLSTTTERFSIPYFVNPRSDVVYDGFWFICVNVDEAEKQNGPRGSMLGEL
ncbi:putative leucoanthocyanidin dioxygenase [Aspergillus campestris IBT 28561]|uniref:Leucoanthocyanidin dioxygenase n=1 Tax=Aspergillus campestris (strain IBT 28561) TaxID=1392248 RepID=A0A2I1DGJ2_ASPC2|nr:putative leucoanthocyanidin dioxygenase [Aspergillus campestris IBT 28561]PKY08990.1 putative leucoanthocyanidin dioxygenase [Aspergillus campestris IBT 28561]